MAFKRFGCGCGHTYTVQEYHSSIIELYSWANKQMVQVPGVGLGAALVDADVCRPASPLESFLSSELCMYHTYLIESTSHRIIFYVKTSKRTIYLAIYIYIYYMYTMAPTEYESWYDRCEQFVRNRDKFTTRRLPHVYITVYVFFKTKAGRRSSDRAGCS